MARGKSEENEIQLEESKRDNTVAITAIIATATVILVCILACAVTFSIFILNAPW
jgi:hypothetical protein